MSDDIVSGTPLHAAWKKGFLFGFYDDFVKSVDELPIPYTKDGPEYKAWLKGYYSNLE